MSVKLGHFELMEQIGKGGMAAVFLAYDPSLNRKVAIKLLDEELARSDPQFVESFIHEAQSAASINHPNIVQIYFVGEENGNYYIAMELLEGRSLDDVIKNEGPLSEADALHIGVQVADALRAAYANHMIHGDIKPQNIFVTKNETAKLLDFGLAKMANIEASAETDGSVWGSAYYISPERVGRKAEDFRSDIYSLGATLFHALVGHPPFDADTADELAQKRLNEKAPGLRGINPDITEKTDQIIARMLNKSTFLRYLDYNLLLNDLRVAEAGALARAVPSPVLNPIHDDLASITNLLETGPVAQPVARLATQPVPQPIARLATQPVPQPIARLATQPVPQPVARLAAQPVPQPVARLSTQPVLQPVARLAAQPVAIPAASHPVAPIKPAKKNLLPLIIAGSAAALLLIVIVVFFATKKSAPTQSRNASASNLPAKAVPEETPTDPNLISVPFHYENAMAKSVALAGDFNNWMHEPMKREGQESWVLRKYLYFGETYSYQFFVDGKPAPGSDGKESGMERHIKVTNRSYP